MKIANWCVAALLVVLVFGCAKVAVHPVPNGTVLEKFAREGHSERAMMFIGQWVPMTMVYPTTYWVNVQGDGCRIEQGMMKDKWDKVKVGDVIAIMDDGSPGSGGGT